MTGWEYSGRCVTFSKNTDGKTVFNFVLNTKVFGILVLGTRHILVTQV